jgi:uncharacterized Fe-S radical SAM superfamily protein PflX
MRYGNKGCAKEVGSVHGHMKVASGGLGVVAKEDAKMIVRIPVFPGHEECCHENALEMLPKYQKRM